MWYARILYETIGYGVWTPTGCTELETAKEYIKTYYRPSGRVVEWLKM